MGGRLIPLLVIAAASCGPRPEPAAAVKEAPWVPDAGAVVTAVAPEQPFHFDHTIHAGKYQIPCQTCHAYADHSPIAGIPTAAKCMGCHRFVDKQKPDVQALEAAFEAGDRVAWNRVTRVPDHVGFNHEPHIQAGVRCQKCHGAVETMKVVRMAKPLDDMGFCVDCHRANHAPVDNCIVCHK